MAAVVTIDVQITVDGKTFNFDNFDEFGFTMPGLQPHDPSGRVMEVADQIHRALYQDAGPFEDMIPIGALNDLIEEGTE